MEISYNLYYILIDKLRYILKERFPGGFLGSYRYLYSDLTHIYDVERFQTVAYPSNMIAEIEITFSHNTLFNGIFETIEKVILKSDGSFILEKRNDYLGDAIEEWILFIRESHYFRKHMIKYSTISTPR
jgi:hypothetical protein